MKVEWRFMAGAALLLVIGGIGYWIGVATRGHTSEYAGVTALIFSFAAYGLIAAYILLQYRRRRGIPRPEDRIDATLEDGAGEIAYFPTASIWPAGLGLGAVLCAAALVWGLWYVVIGFPIFIGAVVGWVFESDHTVYEEEVVPPVFGHRD
jgi:hypothetical protein